MDTVAINTVLEKCPKSNLNFRDISRNVVENMILHEIFRVVSHFPHYISWYITKNDYLRDSVQYCRSGETGPPLMLLGPILFVTVHTSGWIDAGLLS